MKLSGLRNISGITRLLIFCAFGIFAHGILSATPRSAVYNLSTRGRVSPDDGQSLIAGFVIEGNAPLKLAIRGLGPTLGSFGLSNTAQNTEVSVFSGSSVLHTNDSWRACSDPTSLTTRGIQPGVDSECTAVVSLSPGVYTAILHDKGTGGTGLVDIFNIDDTSTSRLTNVSTRGFVGTDAQVLIAGLIINEPCTIIVRGQGPNLANFGISGAVANPKLTLYSGQTVLASNDSWADGSAATRLNSDLVSLRPAYAAEPALLADLQPGAYTAILEPAPGSSTGIGLVEVFDVTPPPPVVIAPAITAQPASITVTAGATATFSVTASGTAPLAYQWFRNSIAIPDTSSSSYTTHPTTTADSGAFFSVVVSNSAGTATSANVTLTVTPASPAAPTGLAALPGNTTVALSWNAVSGASSYKIKRATLVGGPFADIATTTGTTYSDSGRANGTTYFYVVTAVSAGMESANSATVAATPLASIDLPVLPENDPTRNYMGMNVWFLSDWDGSYSFADAMKQARPWQDAADWHNPVGGTDALGWPTADASTVIMTGSPTQINGTYKLIFNGQADVSLMWSAGSVSNKVYTAATNTTTADVSYALAASGSVGIILRNTRRTATSALNSGFTNLRLYRPGYPTDGSVVFTTPFLNALGKTKVVRMMDWTATNQNLTQRWADRKTPLHMDKQGLPYTGPGGETWTTSQTGVPIEHQIQLCNALMSDCWINVPVVADDDFVRKMALALRYGTDGTNPYTAPQANPVYPPLNPALRVYVEYANEIWNSAGGFYSFGVIQDICESLPAGHDLLTPAESSIWYKMWRYPAYRTAIISEIFRSVYGDASMMNRVRPVLMTQQGNAQSTLEQSLNWLNAYARRQPTPRTVGHYLYGAGGSGYYNVNNEPADKTDINGFFATGNYPATQNVRGFGVDSVWAANFGLKRIAYEGGPSLDYYPDANARAINADARMQDMIVKTHDAWSSQGGDLLVYYTVVGPPKWEFTPDISTTSVPKLNGITQLNTQARAPVTLGQQLPGTLIATTQSSYKIRTGDDYPYTVDGLACIGGNDAGEWVAFPGHTNTAFTGSFVVNAATQAATVIHVYVNGVNKGQVTLPASNNHLVNSTTLSNVAIPAGLTVIRLEIVSGGCSLRSIIVN